MMRSPMNFFSQVRYFLIIQFFISFFVFGEDILFEFPVENKHNFAILTDTNQWICSNLNDESPYRRDDQLPSIRGESSHCKAEFIFTACSFNAVGETQIREFAKKFLKSFTLQDYDIEYIYLKEGDGSYYILQGLCWDVTHFFELYIIKADDCSYVLFTITPVNDISLREKIYAETRSLIIPLN